MRNYLFILCGLVAFAGVMYYLMSAANEVEPEDPGVPAGQPPAAESSLTAILPDGSESAEQSAPAGDSRTGRLDDFELDKAKQEEIWAAEHATFEIESKLGPRVIAALSSHDEQAIQALLTDEFQAAAPDIGPVNRVQVANLTQIEFAPSPDSSLAVAAGDFAKHLTAEFSAVVEATATTFRVLRATSATAHSEQEESQEWDVRLLIDITGHTADGQLAEVHSEHDARVRFVKDADLAELPVLTFWRERQRSLREGPGAMFEEVTLRFGLDHVDLDDNWNLPTDKVEQYRFQLAVDDFDRDGWLDLAIATQGQSMLYQWSPADSRFRDVTESLGIRKTHAYFGKPIHAAGWLDFNNDGFPDLLLGNRLYENRSGRTFTDVTERSGLTFLRQAKGVLVADYDCDGLLDLYILYQASSDSAAPKSQLRWIDEDDYGEPNQLWRNEGDGRFRNVTDESNAGGGLRHTLAAAWFHYDDDLYPDLYIANDLSKNVLLRNRGDGTFEDVTETSASGDFATSMGVVVGDTDNNGTNDIYVANMFSKMGRRIIAHVSAADYPDDVFLQIQGSCAGNRLYRRAEGKLSFDEFGEELDIHGVGWAYAPAMPDVDNDGWLDLYASTGFLSFNRGKPDG